MQSRIALSITLLIAFILLFNLGLYAQQSSASSTLKLIKGPAERFTGDVWVDYILNDTSTNLLMSKVFFEQGARSNWHYHVGKQIILAIDGEGYYKEKNKPIRILKKGDVVVIEPGTIHSHGAIHGNKFTQAVMMNDIRSKDATTWMGKVLEEELK